MRNGVLGAMGEIVLKVLSSGELDDNAKNLRDQFLDKLEVLYIEAWHCYGDVNAENNLSGSSRTVFYAFEPIVLSFDQIELHSNVLRGV